jgi:hypothetical protein
MSGHSAEKDAGLPGHENVSFDLTCPRQYTARRGWNRYCECGASLGDTGYSDDEQELLWQMHLRVVRSRTTPPGEHQ